MTEIPLLGIYPEEAGIWKTYVSLQKSLWTVTAVMKLKDACFLEEKLWQT